MKSTTKLVIAMLAMAFGLSVGMVMVMGAMTQERELGKPIAALSLKPEDPSPDPRSGGRSPA